MNRKHTMTFSELVPPEESRFFNWSKPFVQLETTRGCFNTCAFCVSGGEKPVRTLSLEATRKRLDVIHQHGIKNVRVLDRTFNYNNKRDCYTWKPESKAFGKTCLNKAGE